MFKKLFLALLVSLSFGTPAFAGCETFSAFVARVRANPDTIFVASPSIVPKIKEKMNSNRANQNLPPIDVSAFYISFIKGNDGGLYVGVVAFDKNGCAIDDTISILNINQFNSFLEGAGVDAKQFSKMNGA
jgi:hypothetical protein